MAQVFNAQTKVCFDSPPFKGAEVSRSSLVTAVWDAPTDAVVLVVSIQSHPFGLWRVQSCRLNPSFLSGGSDLSAGVPDVET